MEVTVYAWAYGEKLHDLLVGMRHFFGLGNSDPGPIFGIIVTGLCLALVMALLQINRISAADYAKNFIVPILLFVGIFTIPIKVNIVDKLTSEGFTVENIPMGMALPISIASEAERAMIALIEGDTSTGMTGVYPPDWNSIKEYAPFDELLGLMRQMEGTGTREVLHVTSTISEFYDNCALPGLAGGDVTPSGIGNNGNLLDFFKDKLSYGVYFTPVYDDSFNETIMTCENALLELETMLEDIPHDLSDDQFEATGYLLDDLYEGGYQSVFDELAQQQSMIMGLHTNLSQSNPELFQVVSQAITTQKLSLTGAGMVYMYHLQSFIAWLKMVVILCFPLICAFFLIQNGKPFLMWMSGLLWATMFYPIVVMSHSVLGPATAEAIKKHAPEGITLANYPSVYALLENDLFMAAMTVFWIPMLVGLILGWIAPKVGAAVSMMTIGARASGISSMGAASSAADGLGKRLEREEKDRMQSMMLEAGHSYHYGRDHVEGVLGSYNNAYTQSVFGENAGKAVNTSGFDQKSAPALSVSGSTLTQEAQQYARTQSQLREEAQSFMDQLGSGRYSGLSEKEIDNAAWQMSQDKSIQDKVKHAGGWDETRQKLNSIEAFNQLSDEEKNQVQTSVGLSASMQAYAGLTGKVGSPGGMTGVLGGLMANVTGVLSKNSSHGQSVTSQDGEKERHVGTGVSSDGLSFTKSEDLSKAIAERNQMGGAHALEASTMEQIKEDMQAARQWSERKSENESYGQHLANTNNLNREENIDITKHAARLNGSTLAALRGNKEFAHLDEALARGDREAGRYLLHDLQESNLSSGVLAKVAGAANANGQKDVGEMFSRAAELQYAQEKRAHGTTAHGQGVNTKVGDMSRVEDTIAAGKGHIGKDSGKIGAEINGRIRGGRAGRGEIDPQVNSAQTQLRNSNANEFEEKINRERKPFDRPEQENRYKDKYKDVRGETARGTFSGFNKVDHVERTQNDGIYSFENKEAQRFQQYQKAKFGGDNGSSAFKGQQANAERAKQQSLEYMEKKDGSKGGEGVKPKSKDVKPPS